MRGRRTRQYVGRKMGTGHLVAWLFGTALHGYAAVMAAWFYKRNPNG